MECIRLYTPYFIWVDQFIPWIYACFRKWWVFPQIIHFNRDFHYKPSIWGPPIFWNTHMENSVEIMGEFDPPNPHPTDFQHPNTDSQPGVPASPAAQAAYAPAPGWRALKDHHHQQLWHWQLPDKFDGGWIFFSSRLFKENPITLENHHFLIGDTSASGAEKSFFLFWKFQHFADFYLRYRLFTQRCVKR